MILNVTEDKKFLQVESCTQNELDQLQYSLTKKMANWYILKKKYPNMNTDITFMDQYKRIPKGLYREVINLGKKYDFQVYIKDYQTKLLSDSYNEEDFDNWSKEFFESSPKVKPRYYQTDAVKAALKYEFGHEEISTSGGKTLISYMLFKYLHDRGISKRMLYIVPNLSLVTQSEEKFYIYTEDCNQPVNFTTACVYGGAKEKNPDANIIFGTYQSLSKLSKEYFEQFDAIITDECHHAQNNSIQTVIGKCTNANIKIGLTGTMPQEGSIESYTIQSYLGPLIYKLESYTLIEEGNATKVKVNAIELDYLDNDIKAKLYKLRNVPGDEKDGVKLLNMERTLLRSNKKRFDYIVKLISKVTKNTLVLFNDIQNSYGKRIYEYLKENTENSVYYIDGGSTDDLREYAKTQMEENDNVIIVASTGTFSEGIDISNIHNIFVVESNKSENIVRQILGRGMRLKQGKDVVLLIDFIDNYVYGSGNNKINYLMKHGNERERIFKSKKFPYSRIKIKI